MIINEFQGEYRFLSNFWESPQYINGKLYKSNEHWYQSQKSDDLHIQEMVRLCSKAGETKRLAKQIKLREDWDTIKDNIMLTGLRAKFQDPKLKELLLNTKDSLLIEGNHWHDNYWGQCTCKKCINKIGENKLGKFLMKIREELK